MAEEPKTNQEQPNNEVALEHKTSQEQSNHEKTRVALACFVSFGFHLACYVYHIVCFIQQNRLAVVLYTVPLLCFCPEYCRNKLALRLRERMTHLNLLTAYKPAHYWNYSEAVTGTEFDRENAKEMTKLCFVWWLVGYALLLPLWFLLLDTYFVVAFFVVTVIILSIFWATTIWHVRILSHARKQANKVNQWC